MAPVVDAGASLERQPLAAQWVQSPLWDLCWIFSGLWAPVLAVVVALATGTFSLEPGARTPLDGTLGFVLAYTTLSVLHRISTTYAVLATPLLREDIRQNPKRYLYVPLGIFVACLLLSQAFAFHSAFSFMPSAHTQLWAFFALAYVMMLWERWHFCMQEFGVLSIYRIRSKQFSPSDRRFDRVFAVTLMLVVNSVLFVCLAFQDDRDILFYGTPLRHYRGAGLDTVATLAFAIGVLVTGVALVRELRHAQRSLPKVAYYALVGAHTVILYCYPKALGLFFLTYAVHHWMVAVGLFNRITVASYGADPTPWLRYALRVGPVLAASVLFYLFFDPLDRAGNLTPVPDTTIFDGASTGAKLLVGGVVGIFFAFNYLHYYYDRCLYNFGNPAVRKNIAPLLFGPSDRKQAA